MRRNRLLSRAVALLGLALLTVPASATWSIVVVNTETGEVGVASATCVSGLDLKEGAGVIVVGQGAGQAQAALDPGSNRKRMFNMLMNGKSASEILAKLEEIDGGFAIHQYGIATLTPDAATHTGSNTLGWAGGLTGSAGPLRYAIQGNILACEEVVLAAEHALVNTRGDTPTRMMAAMWAARGAGGDSRCSCPGEPVCGCPPEPLGKTARVGYLTVARIGDTDGNCTPNNGCANGDYWLDLNVTGVTGPDPVKQLQPLFEEFRRAWRGHADHVRSVQALRSELPADGVSSAALELALVDIHGNPVPFGGAGVTVQHADASAGLAAIGDIVDHGDGTYSVPLTAGTEVGTDVLTVVVEDGMGPVTLYPFPTLEHVAPVLTAVGGVGGLLGARTVLLLDGDAAQAGLPYGVFGAVELGGAAVSELRPLGFGVLDADGRAQQVLELAPPAGLDGELRLVWRALAPQAEPSNAVVFELVAER